MKKWTLLWTAFALALLFAVPASAVQANPFTVMVLDAGTETYYIGESNQIYSTGSSVPLVPVSVESLVYADSVKLIFTTIDDNALDLRDPSLLYSVALTGNEPEPHLIAAVATDCVYIPADGVVYFVDQSDLNMLMAYDVMQGAYTEALDCGEEIQQLRASVDGLVVDRDAGDQLYVRQLNQLAVSNVPVQGTTVQVYGNFETRLGADGQLQLRSSSQKAGELTSVDTDVTAAAVLDGMVYYLKTNGGQTNLMEYNYASKDGVTLGKFKSPMTPEMDAAGDSVYMLASDGRIYRMQAESNALALFDHVPGGVNTPVIWAAEDRLLLYDAGTMDGQLRFVQEYPLNSDDSFLDDSPAPTRAPVNTPQPDPEPYVLTKGSRGDEVLELQQLLIDHNYPIKTADGIYGSATLDAVKYLQYDLHVTETGSVTEAFMNKLRRNMPDYERFVEMSRGDNGIRVYDLQVKLRSLGWTDAAANGNYGPKTESAVKDFQVEIGHKATGVADVRTEKALWAKDAPHKEEPKPEPTPKPTKKPTRDETVSESDLTFLRDWMNSRWPGRGLDKHGAVYKLQTKLYQMGYLKKNQRTKIYDENTLLALKHYQMDGDFMAHATGLPNDTTLELMFPEDVEQNVMND